MRRYAVLAIVVAGCTGGDDGGSAVDRVATGGGAGGVHAGALGLAGRDVPELTADSAVPVDVVWDGVANRPRFVVGDFAGFAGGGGGGGGGDPVAVARAVLARHAGVLGLDASGADLAVKTVTSSLAGTYVRFAQLAAGIPVLDGEVIALVAGDRVRAITLAQRAVGSVDTTGDRGADAALAAMRAAIPPTALPDRTAPAIERGVVVAAGGVAHLAYRITITAAEPIATWRADVDAATGAVTRLRDIRIRADGTGQVFDPNAVATTGDTALVDGNNADTAALTAALFPVTLPHLDGSGVLRGTFADARGRTARATNAGLTFNFTRSAREFEEVMAYFHIDRAQQRIQDLGITAANNRPQAAIVDAITDDNSYYDPGTLEINYGTGGVDDAEDGEIVLHEYGHAIQDNQVPGWGAGGDASAMGEGFGDYLGGGFSVTLAEAAGHPNLIDPACVGEWDATSYSGDDPPCLRRLDGTKHWPERCDGEPHDDGEVWSAGLWAARTAIDPDTVDALVLEHHFMLSGSATVDDAATALLATDQQVNGGANAVVLRRALFARGLLRTPLAAAPGNQPLDTMDVSVDNPRTGATYPDNLDDTQTVTFPGAGAVRVHFTAIETEEDTAPSCLGGCDNIYLSDADGDLYQILHGTMSDLVSVVVPGDTVAVRLVSDSSVGKMGYHIDRIEMMDGAPLMPDAATGGGPDATGGGEDGGGCCQGSAGGSIPLALIVLGLLVRRPRTRTA